MTNINGQSMDILSENIANLRQLFPEICCEDKVDFDKLKQLLGEYVDDNKERYNFTWNGKGKALRLSQTPSLGTLRPCPEEGESKNWDTTQNMYIEGDNLEVLKLLQKSYHGKIKMIYIDPPYNTGGDFVYPDDFSDSLENYKHITGQVDDEGRKLGTNTEANGRYHTDWLNMMYPRLRLARNLLIDDGVIFISIDENEVDNLKKLCNEVFGEANYKSTITWQRKYSVSNNYKGIATICDYVLIYAKSGAFQNNLLPRTNHSTDRYSNPDNDPRGPWKAVDYLNQATTSERPNLCYDIENPNTGSIIKNGAKAWKYEYPTHMQHVLENRIWWGQNGKNSVPALKLFLSEVRDGMTPHNWWPYDEVGHTQEATKELAELLDCVAFDYPKPLRFINRILQLASQKDDIILDFFSGSATTAHAVMKFNAGDGGNRKFICVQMPEPCDEKTEAAKAGYKTICEIGKERIRRAGDKIKAEVEAKNAQLKIGEEPQQVPDIGFKVFKLDTSNLKKWTPECAYEKNDEGQLELNMEKFEAVLEDSIRNYVEGRSELDVVYEIILKMGLDLTYPLEQHSFDGKNVYSIGFGALMICLDDNITVPVAEGMVSLYKELAPNVWKVVFKDNGFASDSAKTNIKEILKCAGLEEDAFTTI